MGVRYERGSFTVVPTGGLSGLHPFAQVVFMHLCFYANQYGVCFPSTQLLAERCCMTRNSVTKAIKVLIEAKLIVKSGRKTKDKGWMANEYQILIATEEPIYPPCSPHEQAPPTHAHQTCNPCSPNVHELYSENYIYKKENQNMGITLDSMRQNLEKKGIVKKRKTTP